MQQEYGHHDTAKAAIAKSAEHVYPGGGVEHRGARDEIDGEDPIKEWSHIVLPADVKPTGLRNLRFRRPLHARVDRTSTQLCPRTRAARCLSQRATCGAQHRQTARRSASSAAAPG